MQHFFAGTADRLLLKLNGRYDLNENPVTWYRVLQASGSGPRALLRASAEHCARTATRRRRQAAWV